MNFRFLPIIITTLIWSSVWPSAEDSPALEDGLSVTFKLEDGIRDRSPSRGLGDVYKRQRQASYENTVEAY